MSNTSKVITPTVGRKVWFMPGNQTQFTDANGRLVNPVIYQDHPLDATIVYVWYDRMVNLLVVDHAGASFALTSVALVQDGDIIPTGAHAEWMPYQKGQAEKAVASKAEGMSHASAVLYPAIKAAMDELSTLPPSFNVTVNRAFNHLHRAFWSEVPAPASAHPLRPERACTCGPSEACSLGEGDLGCVKTGA